jgi:cytochrome b6-f complex iron-sulfur subunit
VVVAIVIIVILAAMGLTILLLTNRSRASTGSLSRETVKRDTSSPATEEAAVSTSTELEAAGRERSDETQALTRRGGGGVVVYEPVDEEELGVTRRQFFNRGLVLLTGFGVAGFGAAALAFLWPLQNQGGFGGQVNVGKEKDILAGIASYPGIYYASAARAYIVQYPQNPEDLAKAKKVYKPAIYQNMSQLGLVALYQRCVHLGCRVPFCKSSQWFECPCHGSKYSRVGEKKAGPAPRGLDRFYMTQAGDSLVVDTSNIFLGPPIGTNTTNQNAEGPLCV